MRFFTKLRLPHDENVTAVPTSWMSDGAIRHDSRGFLVVLASYVAEVTDAELEALRHETDMPIAEMVADLEHGGYLRRVDDVQGEKRYELVHPDRLGTLLADQ